MVRLEHVALRYGGESDVLHDVDFSLEPGSFHFLTGPSGAGKTSLLKLVYLAHPPSEGRVRLFGEDATGVGRGRLAALRRRIGVVFQDFRLLDHLDVFENVSLPLRVTGLARERYHEDVRELLTWVGLGERAHARPATLSGGEKQRVAIARAVVTKPDLLLADEPTGNVDPEMGRRLMRLFVEMNRLGATVLVATHDPELLRIVSAPVLELADGRIETRRAAA
ncbi:MAG: cell division ATP-binding protein FtsE [Caulobacterales bacterium]|nr:cell division ATP-binding protein FtsE [Caulobacterales bacterium]